MVEETASSVRREKRGPSLESRINATGEALSSSLRNVVETLLGTPQGPTQLARALGVDKVLSSRVLKVIRTRDPVAVLHTMPGPEPVRRLLRAAGKRGVSDKLLGEARKAVDAFDALVRDEAGDRSAFDAIIAAWLPEAREEFELRRKQSIFRSFSQLRGVAANTNLGTVLLHPSKDGEHLDVVWLFGLLGLQRIRPGAPVKLTSRRFADRQRPRSPRTLDGVPVDGLDGLRVDEFCSSPPAELVVQRAGEVVHYTLADEGFGPHAAADLVFAEVNEAELVRYVSPAQKPKRQVFAEVSIPTKVLVFDALLHADVFAGVEPSLFVYDTTFEGVADVNDPSRDIDRMDLCESIQMLGTGLTGFRTAEVPRYVELLRHVCNRLGWDGNRLRGYRCRIDYPLYGSQVVIAFDSAGPPTV